MRVLGIGLAALTAVACAGEAFAQQRTQGYTRRDGTYVAPSYRTAPDSNRFNNFSTRGNVNPYSGRQGSVSPHPPYRAPRSSR